MKKKYLNFELIVSEFDSVKKCLDDTEVIRGLVIDEKKYSFIPEVIPERFANSDKMSVDLSLYGEEEGIIDSTPDILIIETKTIKDGKVVGNS